MRSSPRQLEQEPPGTGWFSPDYATARTRFRQMALNRGARLDSLPVDGYGPAGEPLTIDIAWLGHPRADRVLLHTSGLHGVEGFAGSAIQLALLGALPVIPPGGAIALVHALNPWGMAHGRRTNARNVDLNRNVLAEGEPYEGSHWLYPTLDPLLNPASAPAEDAFLLRLAGAALRHGYRRVMQAIAEGQHAYPDGLFYGGAGPEPEPRLFLEWASAHLAGTEYVFALDVHSGLGARGRDTVFVHRALQATPATALKVALDRPPERAGAPYAVYGGLETGLAAVLGRTPADFVVQELGTRPPWAVLAALRDENRWFHHGRHVTDHPAPARLRETFCPSDPSWRERAVALGRELGERAMHHAFSGL